MYMQLQIDFFFYGKGAREKGGCKITVYGTHVVHWGFNELLVTQVWERSGSVVECLARDRGTASSNLTGVTALWSLSNTHLS